MVGPTHHACTHARMHRAAAGRTEASPNGAYGASTRGAAHARARHRCATTTAAPNQRRAAHPEVATNERRRHTRKHACHGTCVGAFAPTLPLVVPIICVAAQKGGVGKSTIAYELAAALSGVLVDLDYDAGGVTEGIWGYPSARFQRSPLLDALERGPGHPMPQAKVAPRRPALIPSHRDLSPDASAIPADLVTECLTAWAASCAHSCLVVDTHPGGGALAAGAQRAANLVVAPSVLARLEINALAAMVAGYASYPLLVVPNRVPPRPSGVWVERLASAAGDVPVSPLISDHPWLPQRLRRAAITLEPNPGRRVKAAAAEFGAVADTAWGYANA